MRAVGDSRPFPYKREGQGQATTPLLLTAHVATWPYFCLATILYVIPSYVSRGIIFFGSSRPSLEHFNIL